MNPEIDPENEDRHIGTCSTKLDSKLSLSEYTTILNNIWREIND